MELVTADLELEVWLVAVEDTFADWCTMNGHPGSEATQEYLARTDDQQYMMVCDAWFHAANVAVQGRTEHAFGLCERPFLQWLAR